MNGVEGFMYPNEIALQWSVLIVLYPYITGLVAGAFILASLERVFRVEAVKPTYRLALLTALVVPAGRAAAAAVAPGPSRSARRRCTSRRTAPRPWPCSAMSTSGT